MAGSSRVGASSTQVDFCRVLEIGGATWICYQRTTSPDSFAIGATDGFTVWQKNVTRTTKDLVDFNNLRADEICLNVTGNTVCLTLGKGKQIYVLPKLNSCDQPTELAAVLFAVAEKCCRTEERLAEAERTVDSLKQSAASANQSIFYMTAESKRKKTAPKSQPMQAGMSIVNPGSRKRTKAKGVKFN